MRAKELVSIIIPTLNEEGNIERLLRSIFSQDYRPIEVIIVDGGSKDNTLEIIGNSLKSIVMRSSWSECWLSMVNVEALLMRRT